MGVSLKQQVIWLFLGSLLVCFSRMWSVGFVKNILTVIPLEVGLHSRLSFFLLHSQIEPFLFSNII